MVRYGAAGGRSARQRQRIRCMVLVGRWRPQALRPTDELTGQLTTLGPVDIIDPRRYIIEEILMPIHTAVSPHGKASVTGEGDWGDWSD